MSPNSKKLRVAVIGVGSLGRHHVRIYSRMSDVELVGVADTNLARAEEIASTNHTHAFDDYEKLFGRVDAVSLAVPTVDHGPIGIRLLQEGIDVLVEKPIADTMEQADGLIEAARIHQRVLQVGHVERFNPAVTAARKILKGPKFFEVHRLSLFTPRSLDVDVVLDLMIHDLDIVLSFVGAEVADIRAVGLPILTPRVDIANVRLEFTNGCVANLTASRVSTEKVRKLRFFQPNDYVSIDYTRQEMLVLHLARSEDGEAKIDGRSVTGPPEEPLKLELESFVQTVRDRSVPVVTGEEGRRALKVASDIAQKINEHSRIALKST
ncbi:MAG: Gfo/Idh/MocA family oxidoreductase [Acidobacteriia bacterium]|nr:Gfo/Idh/MocA family oxidoreductase [Terriglobia bacterium]